MFLRDGAFPEVAEGENPKRYVRTLLENIRTKDIERRYRIRYKSSLRKMIDHVLNNVPMEMDVLIQKCQNSIIRPGYMSM